MAMRAERAERRSRIGTVRLQIEQGDASGKMVFEAEDVSLSTYASAPRLDVADAKTSRSQIDLVVRNFSRASCAAIASA